MGKHDQFSLIHLSANYTKWLNTFKQLDCFVRIVWVCLTILCDWRLMGWLKQFKYKETYLSTFPFWFVNKYFQLNNSSEHSDWEASRETFFKIQWLSGKYFAKMKTRKKSLLDSLKRNLIVCLELGCGKNYSMIAEGKPLNLTTLRSKVY